MQDILTAVIATSAVMTMIGGLYLWLTRIIMRDVLHEELKPFGHELESLRERVSILETKIAER